MPVAAVLDMTPPRPAFLSEGKSIKSSKSNPPSLRSFTLTGKTKLSFIAGLLSKSKSKVEDQNINPSLPNEQEPKQSVAVARKTTPRRSIENISRSARRISTTLRNASPEPANRVPLPSASSRQFREAALRERGLMPQKDMSALEREQDDRKSPASPTPQTTLTDGMSEADRIKQQWEAKMQSQSTAESPDANSQSDPAESLVLKLDTVQEVPTPLVSPVMAIPSPTLTKMSSRSNLKAPKPPPTIDLPPTPMDPETIPLPHSPFEETCSVRSFPISAQLIPIPPSPTSPSSYSHTESTDPRASEPESNSSSQTPRPNLSLSAAPPSSSPIASPSSPSAYECSDDGALAPPKSRSCSQSRVVLGSSDSEDEFGSIAPPSLATSSQLTLESSLSHSTHNNHKSRPNPLAKTWTNEPKVPVIVESPVESMEQYGLILPINSIAEDEVMKESPADDTPPLSPSVPESDLNLRRKSIFGRRNTKTDGSSPTTRSFASLRRSVIGTLSRGHSPKVDVTNIPPSPSFVSSNFVSSPSVNRKPSLPRQALGPTMHSPGSIWVETNGIEDDETRRVTEMAFLG
ncbi:hypothetical protein D9757_002471 [Collybiopsis confluens]|uniref:Uncharacterized protein n=1 Tax=Collybiopsis confluens TaxID=2823264 RepID=A0A8H5HXR6_9AGAR|nr:hypothetical protein D9757_002471 [Collybiopsis confluens]